MNFVTYLLAGFIAAMLGGLMPGAVNLSVAYTTLHRGAKFAVPVILSAAIGEVAISFCALHGTALVEKYIQHNQPLQWTMVFILLGVGLFLYKKTPTPPRPPGSAGRRVGKGLFTGFTLAFLNPPVLVFWLVAFAYLASNLKISVRDNMSELAVLFFVGIFFGKCFLLWLYLLLSRQISKHVGQVSKYLNKIIGGLLILIGLIQMISLLSR